ncbi:hypothetical protein SLS53_006986 [Cytospora paraplurivora]|uniref:galacturonan 1,4-alpha-galacturonidase n=1 Tax=Cytospora paraplurivora TaxID=2898453 RepID=A0AAN9U418_9PEZI
MDFKNFHFENITASPVLIQQCSHWAGWNVPACSEYPATGFTFDNITWTNFTGWMNEKVGTKSISLACSPYSTCTNFNWSDINIVPSTNGTATAVCTNIDGYDDVCQKTDVEARAMPLLRWNELS